MDNQDNAIDLYMRALKDPQSLIDTNRLLELEKKLEDTDSPIDRLRIQSELNELRTPSKEKYEADFIENAYQWAQENDVPVEAFIAEKVPADVLNKAGFKVGKSTSPSTKRAPRVSRDTIRAAIPQGRPFTVSELVKSCGGTEATVRKTIEEEIEKGNLIDKGPKPDHIGRGKAPNLYITA